MKYKLREQTRFSEILSQGKGFIVGNWE